MNKLNLIKTFTLFLLASTFLLIDPGKAYALGWSMKSGSPLAEYRYQINEVINQSTGKVDLTKNYSSAHEQIWKGPTVISGGSLFIGSQYFFSSFDSNYINIYDSITHNGMTYYRLKTMNSNGEIYIAVSISVYDYDTKAASDFFVPGNRENSSSAKVSVDGNTCRIVEQNASYTSSSCSSNDELTLSASTTDSGSSGKIYFYIKKIPTSEIVFPGIPIISTKVGTGMSETSFASANMAGASMASQNTDTFKLYLNGAIRFDNSCSISGPTTVEVNLDSSSSGLMPSDFTTKGNKPTGYTPKRIDIHFDCSKGITTTFGSINWSISSTAASDGSGMLGVLVARPVAANTIEGLGVKITSDSNGSTVIPFGSKNTQAALLNDKTATASFYAYPTMISDQKPSGGGGYNATATVTFDVP